MQFDILLRENTNFAVHRNDILCYFILSSYVLVLLVFQFLIVMWYNCIHCDVNYAQRKTVIYFMKYQILQNVFNSILQKFFVRLSQIPFNFVSFIFNCCMLAQPINNLTSVAFLYYVLLTQTRRYKLRLSVLITYSYHLLDPLNNMHQNRGSFFPHGICANFEIFSQSPRFKIECGAQLCYFLANISKMRTQYQQANKYTYFKYHLKCFIIYYFVDIGSSFHSSKREMFVTKYQILQMTLFESIFVLMSNRNIPFQILQVFAIQIQRKKRTPVVIQKKRFLQLVVCVKSFLCYQSGFVGSQKTLCFVDYTCTNLHSFVSNVRQCSLQSVDCRNSQRVVHKMEFRAVLQKILVGLFCKVQLLRLLQNRESNFVLEDANEGKD
eukprot:TRINITY_DN4963_c0_g1_i1.p1 TRINITY_DN4963_c0_g1~~TRINITY_DN4963_c0_g1_i1.p1  ORF type:complete len:381 (+),score=-19.46 TRINITY_DN4963_c0_g1_i1:400-1542(+)